MQTHQRLPGCDNLRVLRPLDKTERKPQNAPRTMSMGRWFVLHPLLPHSSPRAIHRPGKRHIEVRSESRPRFPPRKRTIIRGVESLIRGRRIQHAPFVEVAVQHSVGERLWGVPGGDVAGVFEWAREEFLHTGVDEERVG